MTDNKYKNIIINKLLTILILNKKYLVGLFEDTQTIIPVKVIYIL
jgi:hypothetical protein